VQEQALGTGDYLGDLRLRYQTGETVFAHQFNFTVSDEINVQIFNAREPLEAPNFITNNSNNFILPIISTPWGIGSLILAIAAVLSLLSWQGLRHYRRKQIA